MASFKTYYNDYRNFGFRYVLNYWIMGRLCGKKCKHAAVTHYLRRFFLKNPVEDVQYTANPNPYPDSIWVCWWQGEEQMPEVVKICYASLKAHSNGHPVRLVTKDNYKQYVDVPDWVMKKFKKREITITHFSDILRLTLLSRYGGFWMDATLYITGDLPKEVPVFFTLKQAQKNNEYVSAYRWSGYCMGGTNTNKIFSQAYSMLINGYWLKQDKLINYYILDYIYDLLYQTNIDIKAMIDANPYNNPDVMFLVEHMNKPYNSNQWDRIKEHTYVHKLSWKHQYTAQVNDNEQTYYGYIKRELI